MTTATKIKNQTPVNKLSNETLALQYMELDDLLQYSKLSPSDYRWFIECGKELKRRGIRV